MPALSDHQSAEFVKLIYVGGSGSGKTGSLVSLAKAGYKLRIIDADNGLDALVHQIKAQCPEALASVEFETRKDRYKASPMGPMCPSPKAFVQINQLLDKWPDGTTPAEWGKDYILVLDSLTAIGKAAFEWARGLARDVKDPRQWYKGGQDAIDNILSTVTSDSFETNVLILSHVDVIVDAQGITRGAVSSLGKALGPKIPRHFNTMIAAQSQPMGQKVSRKILTIPTHELDLKNPNPAKVEAKYDLNTGLAEIFKALKAL